MVKLLRCYSSAFLFKIVLIETFLQWFCANVIIINPSTEFTNARLFAVGHSRIPMHEFLTYYTPMSAMSFILNQQSTIESAIPTHHE